MLFDVRRRLHLDELRLRLAAVEHVDAHADAVVVERRLEDRLAAAGRDQRARRVDRGAQSALEAHDVAAAVAVELPRELADVLPVASSAIFSADGSSTSSGL